MSNNGAVGCAAGDESPEHENGKLLVVKIFRSLVEQYGGANQVEYRSGDCVADVAYFRPDVP